MDNECKLCGAPGGYPYCNADCREADNPEDEDPTPTSSTPTGYPITDATDPWASDARNYL